MDACETEIHLDNLNQHRIEQGPTSESSSLVRDAVSANSRSRTLVSAKSDLSLETAVANPNDVVIISHDSRTSIKNQSVERQRDCSSSSNSQDDDNDVSESTPSDKRAKRETATPMLRTDESVSSDDTTLDISQNSLECYKNDDERHRQSIAVSPDAVSMTGCSTTEESLSSDETALDLSQNSVESIKCLSDLESVSVSSIIRRATVYSASDDYADDPTRRRVSFPMKDSDLVTGYMEPANPWESSCRVKTLIELIERYKRSCLKHKTAPLDCVLDHLKTLELDKTARNFCLNLKGAQLTPEDCEPLEEILKTVRYQSIILTGCNLNDLSASALFDMFEYYESVVDLDVSDNPKMSTAGWQSCVSMIRKSDSLQSIILRGNPLSESYATNLGKALNVSNLHTLKLEHCGLTGRPLASLCNILRKNTTLRELWLAYNDLYCHDADKIADLLKVNLHLQFLDVSNNNLKDTGIKSIAIALIEQSTQLSFTTRLKESQAKLKAIEFPDAITKPIENLMIGKDNGSMVEKRDVAINASVNGSGGGGSRSMLDALLQLQPGECLAPVQSMTNNNNYDKTIENNKQIHLQLLEQSNSTTETDSSSTDSIIPTTQLSSPQIETISPIVVDSLPSPLKESGNIEINVSYASEASLGSEHEVKSLTNNNTLKIIETDSSAQSPNLEIAKAYDMNENSKGSSCRSETPLIDIDVVEEGEAIEEDDSRGSRKIADKTIGHSPMLSSSRTDFSDDSYSIRSQSCDSLNSDTSLDAIGTLSDEIKAKITKNDTLGRQKSNQTESVIETFKAPRGLQALILWNNHLSRQSGECISDMIASTNSLELLNIGKNTLSNEFIAAISKSLKLNRSLTNLGLQSSHLSSVGIKKLSEILQFGGNSTLERIDIRDNNIQVEGLMALCEALKSNKTIMRIDIDDEPKRIEDDGDGLFHYSKHLHGVRSLIAKNQSGFEISKARSSRKISLTCQSIHAPVLSVMDVKKKSGTRLRSPLPSPPTASPSSSPVPSPSRASRFHVSRVQENGKNSITLSPCLQNPNGNRDSPPRSSPSPTSRFRVTKVKIEDLKDGIAKIETNHAESKPNSNEERASKLQPTKNSVSETHFVFPEIKEPKSNVLSSIVMPPSEKHPTVVCLPGEMKKCSKQPIAVPVEIKKPAEPEAVEIVEEIKTKCDDGTSDPIPPKSSKPKTETRVRKPSWNNQTVGRLFNIFQNPSTLFKSSNSNEADNFSNVLTTAAAATATTEEATTRTAAQQAAQMVIISTESTATKSQSFFDVASKQLKELTDLGKHVLRSSPPTQQQQHQPQLPAVSSAPQLQTQIDDRDLPSPGFIVDAIDLADIHLQERSSVTAPLQMVEIKENISPEHTINSVNSEIFSADRKASLKLETQIVELGENKENSDAPSTTTAAAPLATTQGNDKHEV